MCMCACSRVLVRTRGPDDARVSMRNAHVDRRACARAQDEAREEDARTQRSSSVKNMTFITT